MFTARPIIIGEPADRFGFMKLHSIINVGEKGTKIENPFFGPAIAKHLFTVTTTGFLAGTPLARVFLSLQKQHKPSRMENSMRHTASTISRASKVPGTCSTYCCHTYL